MSKRRRALLNEQRRERLADWLIVIGAGALFVSLFLAWSHQFSAGFLAQYGSSDQLIGVPHNPTAWQLYSATDVALTVLAAGLAGVALAGSRTVRIVALAGVALGVAFTLHALGSPPTNGATIFDSSLSVPRYAANAPAAGIGETVALIGLGSALAGLALSFTVDWGR
jgi:hypothetical protein